VIGGEHNHRVVEESHAAQPLVEAPDVLIVVADGPKELGELAPDVGVVGHEERQAHIVGVGLERPIDRLPVVLMGPQPPRGMHFDGPHVQVKRAAGVAAFRKVREGLVESHLAVIVPIGRGRPLDLVAVFARVVAFVLVPEVRGFVTAFVEVVGDGLDGRREREAAVRQADPAAGVRVLPGHGAGARRAAGRRSAKCVFEKDSLARDAVKVRALHSRAIATKVAAKVVADDVDDVGFGHRVLWVVFLCVCFWTAACRRGRRQDAGTGHGQHADHLPARENRLLRVPACHFAHGISSGGSNRLVTSTGLPAAADSRMPRQISSTCRA